VIVKLTPMANSYRLVGAAPGKEGVTATSTLDWPLYAGFIEDRVAVRSSMQAAGQYLLSANAPLLASEYAVVLRPISKAKKFSGGDVARAQGDGMVFDSVWSFEIPQGAKSVQRCRCYGFTGGNMNTKELSALELWALAMNFAPPATYPVSTPTKEATHDTDEVTAPPLEQQSCTR
jgi:hypothetical protein